MAAVRMYMKLLVLSLVFCVQKCLGANYMIGTGIADMTGPAADVNLVGSISLLQLIDSNH